MRILFVTHHRRSKTFSRCEALARELAARGHELTLMCTADTGRRRVNEYERGGLRWVECPDLLWGRLRSGWDPWNGWTRRRWMAGRSFDLVHLFETRPSVIFPALALLRARRAPLVIDWNDWWGRGGLISANRPGWYRRLFGGMETYFEEAYRPLADGTTVTSQALADRAVGLGVARETILKVANGVEPESLAGPERAAARARFGLDPDALLVGYIGRDVNYDLPLVIDATLLVRGRHPGVKLVLAGIPPPGFDRLVERRGARDAVIHLGLRPYAEMPAVVAALDICLMPFTRCPANLGAWPKKLADYLAAGRPVVTHAVGEVEALLKGERVGVLAGEDARGFAGGILRLADDAALRAELGANARDLARRKLLWSTIVADLDVFYARVADRFRARAADPAVGPRPLPWLPRVAAAAPAPAAADDRPPRVNVLGVRVSATDLPSAVDAVLRAAAGPGVRYVCFTGAHGVIESRRDAALREIHNRSFLTLPDGMPTVWFGQECGYLSMGRVYGPDLMREVLRRTAAPDPAAGRRLRHFLAGATPETLARLKARVERDHPGVEIAGVHAPPFRPLTPEEEAALAGEVRRAAPDFLWVGISTPKQERLMASLAGRLDRGVLLGVGAAFDILAGVRRDAPRWMQQTGLHWLFRLFQEPRRLGPRYARIVPAFAYHAALQLFGIRRYPEGDEPPAHPAAAGGGAP